MGYWEWIVLGMDAAMQDFQGKGNCHSWNNHINKVLAWSKYLPSSSNKYASTADSCRSLSNCYIPTKIMTVDD